MSQDPFEWAKRELRWVDFHLEAARLYLNRGNVWWWYRTFLYRKGVSL